ncbi:MAG: PilZ domain-containing protein [bacterium]
MAGSEDTESSSNERTEPRKKPYPYLPYVNVEPNRSPSVTGFIRNVSRNGFSADFEDGFPYVKGDVLDVRVGYQRAWARVVWVKTVYDTTKIVGFEMHPADFLDSALPDREGS